jgi:small-conductance mechanosensitive channel
MENSSVQERLQYLLGFESLIVLTLLGLISWAFYSMGLRDLKASRHEMLKGLLGELRNSYLSFIIGYVIQYFISLRWSGQEKLYDYAGVITVVFGAMVFVRSVKILVFEYLFVKSRKAGVPVLLVNLVTLMLSIFIGAWLSTSVFGVRWAPLLATSAIVSVVLGLALQDTLGNLFAGVALQFDKPYEIGDWIEVQGTGGQVFVGEVHEITWRATTLFGVFDEVLTLPNRLVAQSEVANYSARKKPIYRGLNITLDADADEETVKSILAGVLKTTKGVIQNVDHFIMLRDLNEKGAMYRLFYPIEKFSHQFFVVDEILMKSQAEFKKKGISISKLRVEVEKHT